MKAKELAELLMKNPEFEVKAYFVDTSDCNWDSGKLYPEYHTLDVSGIADIGYSDKVIVLDLE